jgi:hypothetical protein
MPVRQRAQEAHPADWGAGRARGTPRSSSAGGPLLRSAWAAQVTAEPTPPPDGPTRTIGPGRSAAPVSSSGRAEPGRMRGRLVGGGPKGPWSGLPGDSDVRESELNGPDRDPPSRAPGRGTT